MSSRVDKVRELDHKKSEQSLRQGRKKQREMTKVKWRPRACGRTSQLQSETNRETFGFDPLLITVLFQIRT